MQHLVQLMARLNRDCNTILSYQFYGHIMMKILRYSTCVLLYREPEILNSNPLWALQARFDMFGTSLDRDSDYIPRSLRSIVNEEEKHS